MCQGDNPHLKRPDKKRYEIRRLARKRFLLGYPPRKNSDTSIGDAINWEWIISCAQTSSENHNILLVSRDSDFGIVSGDGPILNDWLRREFKDRVSQKRKIELTNKLTLALKRLDEAVNPEDEKEEKEIIKSFRTLTQADLDALFTQNRFNKWSELIARAKPDVSSLSEEEPDEEG